MEEKNSASSGLFCTRRQFVAGMATAAAASLAGGLLAACAPSPNTPPSPGQETLDLTDPKYAALKNSGGAVKFPWTGSVPFIVRNTGTGYEAFSSYCTHVGCEVDLPSGGNLTAGSVITCPCHGSKFDANGNRISGSARASLYPAQVTVSGTNLTITYG